MKKVALITGAGSGIGKGTAELFSREGWSVVGVDVNDVGDPVALDRFIRIDISMKDSPAQIIEQVRKEQGRLDALVNNAAMQVCKPLVETTAEEWDLTMASNVRAPFLFCVAGHALLKKTGGAIVNVSSVHALATSVSIAAYAASKGALLALTKATALEFAQDNIRVNAVLPGAVDTPMLRSGLARGHLKGQSEDELIAELGKKHPLERIGHPQEIAQAVLFLADSQRSGFMTGQALVVDGGATAKLSTE